MPKIKTIKLTEKMLRSDLIRGTTLEWNEDLKCYIFMVTEIVVEEHPDLFEIVK